MRVIEAMARRLARLCGYELRLPNADIAAPIDVLDLVIRDHERHTEDFFVLQVGANDGSRFDPIRSYITERHWAGLLVEPQPHIFEKLRENYGAEPQLKFENAAIAKEDGAITLYTLSDEGGGLPLYAAGLATLDRKVLLKQKWQIPNIESRIREIEVPAMTVASLLAKHGVKKIDLLQIDTEGYDFEIIKMFDFDVLKPAIIHFEHKHLPPQAKEECFRHLVRHGYRLAAVAGDTVAYLEEGAGGV